MRRFWLAEGPHDGGRCNRWPSGWAAWLAAGALAVTLLGSIPVVRSQAPHPQPAPARPATDALDKFWAVLGISQNAINGGATQALVRSPSWRQTEQDWLAASAALPEPVAMLRTCWPPLQEGRQLIEQAAAALDARDTRTHSALLAKAGSTPRPRGTDSATDPRPVPVATRCYGAARAALLAAMVASRPSRRPSRGWAGDEQTNAPESPPLLPPGFPFPPASAETGEGRTANIKGVGKLSCVDLAASPYRVDQWMAQFEQRPNLGPYNCHYYTRTHITTLTSRSPTPQWPETGFNGRIRRTPDDDCLDDAEMGRLGFVPARPGFLAVGDIFLVTRRDSAESNCLSTHSAIVIRTTQGRDPILRQKIDPNTCVVDLPLTDFTKVFLSVANPGHAWRYDPSATSSREAPGTSCPPGMIAQQLGEFPWCRHPKGWTRQ